MSHGRKLIWPVLAAWCLGFGCDVCPALDANEIIERATAALKSDWASDPLYACTEKDEVQKGNRITSKTFEVLMIDGSDYNFPLAVNDEPLSPMRRKAELLKLKNEVRRRAQESALERQSRIKSWKKRHDENGELLLDFQSALAFQLVGEEIKDGHPAYAFSGKPKADFKPVTRAQKVLSGIQGRAWVEKETLHPIRVECNVIRPVSIYAVLATLLPGTKIDIGMTKVADSIWLIDLVSMNLSISKLHMFQSSSTTRFTYTGYRPNAAALEELLSEAERE